MNMKEKISIPPEIQKNWQSILKLAAELFHVPAALIMELSDPEIKVFLSEGSEQNPYRPGDSEKIWNSGLYCEQVIRTKKHLHVPNALEDEAWSSNPDVALNMISYLGFPLFYPNDEPFGTICVLDEKRRDYSETYLALLKALRDLLQYDLELLYVNNQLGNTNSRLYEYLGELKTLRGIVSICSHCKSIKDNTGTWRSVEDYLIGHPSAEFSHGICPRCYKKATT